MNEGQEVELRDEVRTTTREFLGSLPPERVAGLLDRRDAELEEALTAAITAAIEPLMARVAAAIEEAER